MSFMDAMVPNAESETPPFQIRRFFQSSPKESSTLPASHYKRKVKKNVDRNNRGRFRTQPVTFMEIKVR